MRHVSLPIVGGEPSRRVGTGGRELINVRDLLEWAFGVECASIDFDEVDDVLFDRLPSAGAEYRIGQQLALGQRRGEGVRPDTSFGRSYPHDDAELVVTILRNIVPWHQAVRVAELARAGQVPDWGREMRARCVPREWRQCKHGLFAKTERVCAVRYRVAGRVREVESRWCPVIYRDTAVEVARRRRAYLEWWGALLSVLAALRTVRLERFEVTARMPPMEPWKAAGEKNP